MDSQTPEQNLNVQMSPPWAPSRTPSRRVAAKARRLDFESSPAAVDQDIDVEPRKRKMPSQPHHLSSEDMSDCEGEMTEVSTITPTN